MKPVLEIEYKQINEEYYAWWITHQDEEVFKRGEFNDESLYVHSYGDVLFTGDSLWIRDDREHDNLPIIINKINLNKLIEIVAQVNEKYGNKKKTPEEIFAKYTPVPFKHDEYNYYVYYNSYDRCFYWTHEEVLDFSVSGIRYYTREDVSAIVKELNENCR